MDRNPRIEEALRSAARRLAVVSERPRLEAEILMAHLLGRDRVWLHLHTDQPLGEFGAYKDLVARRLAGEPIEYITGRVSFYDIELEVGPGVLIPRPETELLVDLAVSVIQKHGIGRVCEIGVGSGAISVMLARRCPQLRIVATDISKKALSYARKNIEKFALQSRIELVHADLMEGVVEKIDMVVSNPPYIAADYLLPQPVRYEPKEALIGGTRGDETLRRIIDETLRRRIGHLVCEMGYDQKASIAAYCAQKGVPSPRFYQDLAGFDRGFYLRLDSK